MGRKGGITPSKLRVLRDKDLVIKYYFEGRTMQMVCDKMLADHNKRIHIPRVSVIIKEATTRWKTEQGELIEDHKMREIEAIDKLQITYTMAWERSMAAAETMVEHLQPVKTKGGRTSVSKPSVNKAISTIRATAGDPRFLLGIQWCIDKRCELLGHDAPQKIEANITGVVTNNTTIRRVVFKRREYDADPEIFTENKKDEE